MELEPKETLKQVELLREFIVSEKKNKNFAEFVKLKTDYVRKGRNKELTKN